MFAHHHVPHDRERPWGGRRHRRDVLARARRLRRTLGFDLVEPGAPEALMEAARDALGHVDILVCNHASSGPDGAPRAS